MENEVNEDSHKNFHCEDILPGLLNFWLKFVIFDKPTSTHLTNLPTFPSTLFMNGFIHPCGWSTLKYGWSTHFDRPFFVPPFMFLPPYEGWITKRMDEG